MAYDVCIVFFLPFFFILFYINNQFEYQYAGGIAVLSSKFVLQLKVMIMICDYRIFLLYL